MTRLLAGVGLALLLAACATKPTHPDAFSFGIMGDAPYSDEEERHFVAMIERMNAEDLAFVVHVGDFKGSGACDDALFARRKAQFEKSAHPFLYTPGDNEWTDCRKPANGRRDVLERLARLREVFFADRWSLGTRRIETLAQSQCLEAGCPCPAHPENRFWTRAGVRFVTLHIVGSDNNIGFDAASDAEARCREQANRAWLDQAVRAAERSETRALVVLAQANPWFAKKPVHRAFLQQMEEAARRVRRPVLFVHGDSHTQRVDAPFTDTMGHTILNLTRLETYGSPWVGWVKVTVDPDDPQVFRFEPRLEKFVLPK